MSYTKSYFIQSKDYDIVLINWEKDAITKIHDHPEIGCHLVVVSGLLEETLYSDNIIKTKIYPNQSSFRKGNDKHTIKALEKSQSIHIYMPGFYKPNYF